MEMKDMLLEKLLNATKNDTKIIFKGDTAQLPSVGSGNILCNIKTCKK